MPYFLDGNNLIGLARKTSRPSGDDRAALITELAARLRRTQARAVLFFDGGGEKGSSLGSLSIRPCLGISADDQIIREIESLPLEEQVKVIRFAYQLDGERKLTGADLSALAERMARTNDPAEAMMLREEITRGFYGVDAVSTVR